MHNFDAGIPASNKYQSLRSRAMDDRTERPILFSGPMVRAILAGTKSQTRRVVKPQPPGAVTKASVVPRPADGRTAVCWSGDTYLDPLDGTEFGGSYKARNPAGWRCKYGAPGSLLWVRETSRAIELPSGLDGVRYLADEEFRAIENTEKASDAWCKMHHYRKKRGATVPGIHMPRWASRILLEITEIRVEKLNDISEADAKAEGITEGTGDFAGCFTCGPAIAGTTAAECYARLWDSINGSGSWARNEWVWCISFQRVTP